MKVVAKVLRVNLHHPQDGKAFAYMIADGSKTVELRSWTTDFRGPLLIEYRGQIIAVVDLVDCRIATTEDINAAQVEWATETELGRFRFAWVLQNPKLLEAPLAHVGKKQLYDIELKRDQLPEYFERR